jgi:hypothetical protein
MTLLVAAAVNWLGCWAFSVLYALWLWRLSGDAEYFGVMRWRGFFPVLAFGIVSKKSWFGRIWKKFAGHGLLGAVLLRVSKFDTQKAECVIAHELRHHEQQLALGFVFHVLYAVFHLIYGYEKNPFEVDARRAEQRPLPIA